MQHLQRGGGEGTFEIDHFDPRKKKEYLQSYANLYLASRHCNGKKRDLWPTEKENRLGIRFLDCCKEADYGEQIFEDPDSHRVFGVTPAGRYHVRILDLNAPHLVQERKERAAMLSVLTKTFLIFRPKNSTEIQLLIQLLRGQLDQMIPAIPYQRPSKP